MENELHLTYFVAVDFEYATRVKGTVCSVGIVSFNKFGQIIDKYYTLVKPPKNEYEWFTTKTHKINSIITESSPEFVEIFPEIKKRLNNHVVVAHGAFHTDKHCLEQAMEINRIDEKLEIDWVCTQQLCGCSLDVACKVIEIKLDHHQALSDAIACGKIFVKYLNDGLPLNDFQKFKEKSKKDKIEEFFGKSLKGEIFTPDFENAKNTTNPFFMKKVVISGFSFTKKTIIATELKELGADIDSNVTKKTNFLLIGPTYGPSKFRKMKNNIAEGKNAKIITLEEFNSMKG